MIHRAPLLLALFLVVACRVPATEEPRTAQAAEVDPSVSAIVATALPLPASQPPSPSAREEVKPQQTEAGSNPAACNGCCCSPQPWPSLVMLVAPTPDHDAGHRHDDGESQSSTDWWMIRLTSIMAFAAAVQALVSFFQNRNMRRTMDETRRAAEAAFASAWGTHDQAQIAKDARPLPRLHRTATREQIKRDVNHPPNDKKDDDGGRQVEPRPDIPALNDPRAYEEYSKGRNEQRRAKRGRERRRRDRRRIRRGAKLFAEMMVVVLTVGVLLMTYSQVRIMERQNELMNRALVIEQRATLTVGPGTLNPETGFGDLVLTNLGRSPASKYRIRLHTGRFANGTKYVGGGEYTIEGPAALFAGDSNARRTGYALQSYEPQRHAQGIRDGSVTIVLAGEVIYDTGVGTEDIAGFCWASDQPAPSAGNLEIWNACSLIERYLHPKPEPTHTPAP